MSRPFRSAALLGSFLLGAGAILLVRLNAAPVPLETRVESPRAVEEMSEAAANFLAALSADQQRRAGYLFKDEERRNFHFFPIPRRGIPFKELNAAQLALAHALLSTGLSPRGYAKATTVMSLGQILRDTDPKNPNPYRDSDQYYVTIFGKPDPKGTWGWRIEGFHLSLNFTVVGGKSLAGAPSFFGAHPAVVKDGPRKGLEVLRLEEDLGRQLAKSFDREQRIAALFDLPKFEDTVGGLLTGNARKIEGLKPRGLPVSRMDPRQKEILAALLREHAGRLRGELAEADLAKIARAGIENVHFSWSGGMEAGQPHHYMIHGPTFLVELDNTQDEANHVHTIWRDLENDFGEDLLRRHYAEHHGK